MYNKKQSDLLKKSIIKWESIVDRTGVDNGTKNCALCQEYYDSFCEGCPIYEFKSNEDCHEDCHGTPYWDWVDLTEKDEHPYKNTNDKTQKAAEKELEFLEMLLEKTILFRDLTL